MNPRMSMRVGPPPPPPPPPPLLAGPPPEAQDTVLYLIYSYSYGGPYTYSFHKIDPCDGSSSESDDDIKPLPPPLFYLDVKRYPSAMGFLTLGPQILMFGGIYQDGTGRFSPDVFVYDTTKEHSVGEDPANLLAKLPPMIAPKVLPIVFTVAGKIYVLSSIVEKHDPSPTFEEFDMETQSWSPLPQLPRAPDPAFYASRRRYNIQAYRIHDRPRYTIKAYGILDSTIIVLIPMGLFMLDFTNQAQWKEVTTLGGVPLFPFNCAAHYIDGVWYALGPSGLTAYDFISPIGLRKTWFASSVRKTQHFGLLRLFQRSLVFRVGCQTVGLASSGLKCEYGQPYIILQLFLYSKRARTKFLFPIHHHVLKFVMKDAPGGEWDGDSGEVSACFPMRK